MSSAEFPRVGDSWDTAVSNVEADHSRGPTKIYTVFNRDGSQFRTFTKEEFDRQFAGTPSGDLGVSLDCLHRHKMSIPTSMVRDHRSGIMTYELGEKVVESRVSMGGIARSLKPDAELPMVEMVNTISSASPNSCDDCTRFDPASLLYPGAQWEVKVKGENPIAHFHTGDVLMRCDEDHVQPVPSWSVGICPSVAQDPEAGISLEGGVRSREWDCFGCGRSTGMTVMKNHRIPVGYFQNTAPTHGFASVVGVRGRDTAASGADVTATSSDPRQGHRQGEAHDGHSRSSYLEEIN